MQTDPRAAGAASARGAQPSPPRGSCPACGELMDPALAAAGDEVHPMCLPRSAWGELPRTGPNVTPGCTMPEPCGQQRCGACYPDLHMAAGSR
jgi:hypothetical protein